LDGSFNSSVGNFKILDGKDDTWCMGKSLNEIAGNGRAFYIPEMLPPEPWPLWDMPPPPPVSDTAPVLTCDFDKIKWYYNSHWSKLKDQNILLAKKEYKFKGLSKTEMELYNGVDCNDQIFEYSDQDIYEADMLARKICENSNENPDENYYSSVRKTKAICSGSFKFEDSLLR